MATINKQDTDGNKGNLKVGEFGLDIRTGNEKIYIGLTGTDSGEALVFENEIKEYIDDADDLKADKTNVLELDNTTYFNPSSAYHPTTKKYVDDATDGTSTLALFNATGSAPVYACRAWVNFDGTGTVSIRESGNVSSITDNGVGDYTVNFTTAMPDANYSNGYSGNNRANNTGNNNLAVVTTSAYQTSSTFRFVAKTNDGGGGQENADHSIILLNFFR